MYLLFIVAMSEGQILQNAILGKPVKEKIPEGGSFSFCATANITNLGCVSYSFRSSENITSGVVSKQLVQLHQFGLGIPFDEIVNGSFCRGTSCERTVRFKKGFEWCVTMANFIHLSIPDDALDAVVEFFVDDCIKDDTSGKSVIIWILVGALVLVALTIVGILFLSKSKMRRKILARGQQCLLGKEREIDMPSQKKDKNEGIPV